MTDLSYIVDRQAPTQKLVPGAGLQDGYTIYWHTADGHRGQTWVPLDQYTADRVREQITATIVAMQEVQQSGQ